MIFAMRLAPEVLRASANDAEHVWRHCARVARDALAAHGYEIVRAKAFDMISLTTGIPQLVYWAEGVPFPPSAGWDADGRECWEYPC